MEYTKLNCILTPDNELARELLVAELGSIGFESFVETQELLEAYIPSKDFAPDLLASAQFQESKFFHFQYSFEVIADQNWNEIWEKNYFEPLLIENQCLIRAPFHETYPNARYEIVINPRMAFGTGNHETTHLMIKAMLEIDLKEMMVLDMGCGSGILSILASMKGATEITAIDIDEWSYNNTIENAALNNTKNILVSLGDASLLSNQQFDMVLANIQRNILLQDMPAYRKVMKTDGILVMSGFYEADLIAIHEKAAELGMKLGSTYERSGWYAAVYTG